MTDSSVRDDLVKLSHRGHDVRDVALGAARILARVVPFDGVCLVAMDPATLLPTAEVVENGLPPEAMARMTGIELRSPTSTSSRISPALPGPRPR